MSYKIGEIVEGKVTGIQPYGAFVAIDEQTSGLVHISEISDGFVRDIHRFMNVGDTVRLKILAFDEQSHQAKLSLKALQKHARARRSMYLHNRPILPQMKIGFRSIQQELPKWIEQAKERLDHDEI